MPSIINTSLNRRRFFAYSSAAALTAGTSSSALALDSEGGSTFEYEITRTDAEWRERLNPLEYAILREGKTEKQKTSPLWNKTDEGTYHCRGCDLPSFDGSWKVVLEKGWAFFYHAIPNNVLMGIDGVVTEYGDMAAGYAATPEIHCRRCGSHLGHFLIVEGIQTHCINGTSLVFKPVTA
ncbi:peptide-methionine (R)-S-oxide reductase [Litoreibacter arenae]|uniref:peptide-methionine (R)-S-oxide reductase n=1 Tax=Litoreibacter arenae DSM 19593 TaxID=1123360 RepID=S9QGG4_9RHOB|nr:peptide-methionine (R)-S-oxide reductase [Litoreibacter arenae]EPX78957.1 Peptide methionine sulfoxide reductase MsrB [Litoreibacter arenae DSM 19593]